jgi:hypothetical protein
MDASPQQVQLQGGWVTADADAAMGENDHLHEVNNG